MKIDGNILITGSRGFIGSSLLNFFKNRDEKVLELDFDIRDTDKIQNLFLENKINSVLHFAGISNPRYCEKNPQDSFDINCKGTVDLYKICERHNVSNFIFASTAHVYKPVNHSLRISETSGISADTVYSKSKFLAEQQLKENQKATKLSILRLFNHAHVSQTGDFFFPKMMKIAAECKVTENEFKFEPSSLESYIDLSSIQSLIRKIHVLLKSDERYKTEIFNICSGKDTKLIEIVSWISKIYSLKLNYTSDKTELKDQHSYIGSDVKFNTYFNFNELADLKTEIFEPL